jgi:hypothetical protein
MKRVNFINENEIKTKDMPCTVFTNQGFLFDITLTNDGINGKYTLSHKVLGDQYKDSLKEIKYYFDSMNNYSVLTNDNGDAISKDKDIELLKGHNLWLRISGHYFNRHWGFNLYIKDDYNASVSPAEARVKLDLTRSEYNSLLELIRITVQFRKPVFERVA